MKFLENVETVDIVKAVAGGAAAAGGAAPVPLLPDGGRGRCHALPALYLRAGGTGRRCKGLMERRDWRAQRSAPALCPDRPARIARVWLAWYNTDNLKKERNWV